MYVSVVRMVRHVSRSVRNLAVAIVATALSGCPDDPHFDAEAYEITYTNEMFTALGGGPALVDPANYVAEYLGYTTPACPNGTTTIGPGDRTIDIDWHGCVAVPGTDFVGTFEYAGDGIYEGLIDVTSRLSTVPQTSVTYTVLLRLEPRSFE